MEGRAETRHDLFLYWILDMLCSSDVFEKIEALATPTRDTWVIVISLFGYTAYIAGFERIEAAVPATSYVQFLADSVQT
jgi:hypothetical protein